LPDALSRARLPFLAIALVGFSLPRCHSLRCGTSRAAGTDCLLDLADAAAPWVGAANAPGAVCRCCRLPLLLRFALPRCVLAFCCRFAVLTLARDSTRANGCRNADSRCVYTRASFLWIGLRAVVTPGLVSASPLPRFCRGRRCRLIAPRFLTPSTRGFRTLGFAFVAGYSFAVTAAGWMPANLPTARLDSACAVSPYSSGP